MWLGYRPVFLRLLWIAACYTGLFLDTPLQSQPAFLGDARDGNRSVPVHLIPLYDEFGSRIFPSLRPLLPFSTRQTCGKCHDYAKIGGGWHFSARDSSTGPGRPGEPWVLADPVTATQVPISLRPWQGTYPPGRFGLSALQFVERFGSHLPGGGIGEVETASLPENFLRWQVTGKLEINCLSCHDAEPAHDQAKYAIQISRQNFRWAAAASSGFARVSGSARDMPDNWDVYSAVPAAFSDKRPPQIAYAARRFNSRGEVFFDIVRRIPAERCYFCHSTKVVGRELWQQDEDVHLHAGMTCVDCHRNGLDHMMVRGYEGEAELRGIPELVDFTCAGCHLTVAASGGGRFAAPRPQHRGLPPVHFKKLTCTACHAGPLPQARTARVQTSRSHKLGTYGVVRGDSVMPHIVAPVFARQADGKIAPHKMLWPAYWAELAGGKIQPLPPERVRPFAFEAFLRDSTRAPGNWARWQQKDVAEVLRALSAQDSVPLTYAYITGGRLYQLLTDSTLQSRSVPEAEPYLWPLAHDVRPAAQSLGAKGCGDCHALDAPFHFARVEIPSPLDGDVGKLPEMTYFMQRSNVYEILFSLSFLFRPALQVLIAFAALLLGGILLTFAARAFGELVESFGGGQK